MTAAEPVETSVTAMNNISQDFTNLDDQRSETLTDTPGFKPFTLEDIFIGYTRDSMRNFGNCPLNTGYMSA